MRDTDYRSVIFFVRWRHDHKWWCQCQMLFYFSKSDYWCYNYCIYMVVCNYLFKLSTFLSNPFLHGLSGPFRLPLTDFGLGWN